MAVLLLPKGDLGANSPLGGFFFLAFFLSGHSPLTIHSKKKSACQIFSSLSLQPCSFYHNKITTMADKTVIKPTASAPAIDTSSWPLLLKVFS